VGQAGGAQAGGQGFSDDANDLKRGFSAVMKDLNCDIPCSVLGVAGRTS